MEEDFSIFLTGNFLLFHFHSILKFSSIFHSIIPYQGKFRPEATRNLHCTFATLSVLLQGKQYGDRPVGRAVTRSSLEREVRGSNLGPVKSDTVLPTARHRCNISSKGAVLPGRNDAEMGPANSLHASAYYSEYK